MKRILIIGVFICCLLNCNIHLIANESTQENFKLINEDYTTSAQHAIVYDVLDGRIVYDKGANDQIYPASMTKIMSVIVALDKIDDLDQTILMDTKAFEGLEEANASVAGFKIGQVLTYRDLLAGTLLPSGAEASNQLAISLYGSEGAMVIAMNDKVKELHLSHTHFVNTSGLHDDNHYTTPYEMAKIVEVALHQEVLYQLLISDTYTLSDHSQVLQHTTNQMGDLDKIVYFEGGKTGFTLEAQNCLASFSTYENERLIMIVQGIPTRERVLEEVENLYANIYQNNKRSQIIKKGEKVGEISVLYGDEKTYPIKVKKDYSYFLPNEEKAKVYFEVQNDLEAPIKKGQGIGTITIKIKDEVISKFEVSASEEIKRNNIKYYGHNIWMFVQENLFAVCLAGATIILFIIYRRTKRKL